MTTIKSLKKHFVLDTCIGHRGLAANAPENTLGGFHAAANAGLSWVEFDVRLSSDNAAVLSHDADLRRCCGRRGRVSSHTKKDLAKIIANRGFTKNKLFINEGIPSLSDTIKILMAHNIGAVIEIKPARNREEQTVRAVKAALPSAIEKVIISSFSMPVLLAAKKILPHIPRAYNRRNPDRTSMDNMKKVAAANIHCGVQVRTATIKKFAAAGYGVYCFTTDSATQARKLLANGAHGVFSNTNLLPMLKNKD